MPSYSGFFFRKKAMYRDTVVEMSVPICRPCETEEQQGMSNPNSKTQFFHMEWKTLRNHHLTTSFDLYFDEWFGKILAIAVADVPVPVEGTGPALKYCSPPPCTSHRRRRPTWNRQGQQRQRRRSSGSRSPTGSRRCHQRRETTSDNSRCRTLFKSTA